ncbi:MAG: BsaWI family type II restriction enzyme [Candidatus Jordarchaeales archaeon]
METVEERQRRVTLSGGKWEEYVRIYLNEKLEGSGIEVIYGKHEQQVKAKSEKLWKALCLPIKHSFFEEKYIWGDLDLVAVKDDIPIAVISCKTSLHGRLTETLFWSLVFRIFTKTKVVLATSDTGSGKKGKLKTEWGSPDKPNQNRLLAEIFLDGVYVENVPEFCPELIEPTVFGGIVKPLSELPDDLKKWAEEISKLAHLRRRGFNKII